MHSRNFNTPKNKEYEKTQKQMNELRDAINKHQSETEDTIGINELKVKIKNIKEEVTKDMENLRKKESNKNTKHSGRATPAD
jgi:hypothetical protein